MCVMVQIYLNICKENKNFHSFHYWNKGNVYWQSHQSQNIRIDTDKQTTYTEGQHTYTANNTHRANGHQAYRQYIDKARTQTAHRHKQTVHRQSKSQQ